MGTTVWVITTHTGHGEDADVLGVYASKDAARAALEAQPNMSVSDKPDRRGQLGGLMGEPVDDRRYPHVWALAEPMEVHG